MNCTPLRYPGGKSIMTTFFIDLINANSMKNVVYAEPYAGGAGTAINLLLNGFVNEIMINDANICIYSFWHYLIKDSDRFIEKIKDTNVTIDEWFKQKEILKSSKLPTFELAFATFFLSRTNRSGILTASAIGGNTQEKQDKAMYKIDCRYNKNELCSRISKIAKFSDKIIVSNLDAIDFLKKIKGENIIVYLDPPYYVNGKFLYMNHYKHDDHLFLSDFLKTISNFKWVLSYDNVKEIRDMYSDLDLYEFSLIYTAQNIKNGRELLTHSKNIIFPKNISIRRPGKDIRILKIDKSED